MCEWHAFVRVCFRGVLRACVYDWFVRSKCPFESQLEEAVGGGGGGCWGGRRRLLRGVGLAEQVFQAQQPQARAPAVGLL